MVSFIFTKKGKKNFDDLQPGVRKRIINKLKKIKKHPDILSVLKNLHQFDPATHRLRIGDYRLILEQKYQHHSDFEFWILEVGHRKNIYK